MKRTVNDAGSARAAGLALLALAAVSSCDPDDPAAYNYYYYDPYLYAYYYPADLAYSSLYWAYDWTYSGWYLYAPKRAGAVRAAAAIGTLGSAIRALARGEEVCPGRVTVTPRTGPAACSGGDRDGARTGAKIVFDGCPLPGGATVTGTIDIQAMHAAARPACAGDNAITVRVTSTATDVSYTTPQGERLVIPSQTDTSTVSFSYGANPATIPVASVGRLQFFGTDGVLASDVALDGTRVFTNAWDGQTYTVDGTVNVQARSPGSGSGTMTGTGLVRSGGCCRPTGGTLVLSLAGTAQPGQPTFTFGPTCGAATIDGIPLDLSCL